MTLRDVNSVRLFVAQSGAGDPLVLVHGSWDDHRVWALIEAELAERFTVVSYDRRGHTDSEGDDRTSTRRDDEDDLAELIGSLAAGPAFVVANSFGASIALGLAARRPELFRRLCAHEPPLLSLAADDPTVIAVGDGVGPVLEMIERGEDEAAAEFFVENVAVGPGAWAMMTEEQRSGPIANAGTFAGEMADPAFADIDLDGLGHISFPVLLTQGDQSPPFFAKVISSLAASIPTAAVATIEGAGHVPHETHPREYVELITAFADR